MLKLSLPTEPYWIDVGLDVRMQVRPCTSAVFYQARAFMNQQLQQLGETYRAEQQVGFHTPGSPDLADRTIREALAEQYLTLGLARAGILAWEGVLEADSDAPAPVTPQKIDELFGAYWIIAETFRQNYTGMRELLESEKNASGHGSAGTTETGRNTAEAVPDTTPPASKGGKATKTGNKTTPNSARTSSTT